MNKFQRKRAKRAKFIMKKMGFTWCRSKWLAKRKSMYDFIKSNY